METTLTKPKNQTAEVLFELLTNTHISRRLIFLNCGVLNCTARIAELRNVHYLDVKCVKIPAVNKHGREIKYGIWSIDDKEKAVEVYHKINK